MAPDTLSGLGELNHGVQASDCYVMRCSDLPRWHGGYSNTGQEVSVIIRILGLKSYS